MRRFTLVQKIRNKIRLKGSLTLKISKKAKIVGCTVISKGSDNTLILEEGVNLRGVDIEITGDNSYLSISKNSIIGKNCYLSARDGAKLIIEENCMFSRNVKLMTSDGHPIYKDDKQINNAQNITIRKGVWLADNVTILKGVEVAEGSIVGINSTLTKSISSNVIAVGNPAKVVKDGVNWSH